MTTDATTAPRATLPAAVHGPRVAARQRRRRLTAVEAVAAVILIVVLAATFYRQPPAPLGAGREWILKAGPAINALALAVAHASADPGSQATIRAVETATANARKVGPPPEPTAAREWAQVLEETSRAEAATSLDVRAQLLNEAGLALVAVDVATRSA